MNRSIFEVVPEFEGRKEFIDSVMSENGKDIEKAKSGNNALQEQLDKANATIEELNATISGLKESVTDADALREKISAFEKKEAELKELEAKKKVEDELAGRFNAVVGDGKFINEFTRDGAYKEFKSALRDDANKGKGDKEIYDAITKDKNDWFQSKQSFVNIAGVEKLDASLIDAENFKKMTLIQQMEFANNHPAEYDAINKLL